MRQVATIRIEQDDGGTQKHRREFGGFKQELDCLVESLRSGIGGHGEYRHLLEWKSLYAHIERAGIETWVVNAHHIKNVPGRKADIWASGWRSLVSGLS